MSKSISKEKTVKIELKQPTGKFDLIGKFKNLSQEDKIGLGILLLLVFITYSIRSKFYGIPFERDEGAYSHLIFPT